MGDNAMAKPTGVQVRELKSKDLFRLMRIIKKSRSTVDQLFRESITIEQTLNEKTGKKSTSFDVNQYEVGAALVFELLDQAEDEIRPWLADMAEMTPEEFDELSIPDTVSIIEQIVRQEDWSAFLGRFSDMVSISNPA